VLKTATLLLNLAGVVCIYQAYWTQRLLTALALHTRHNAHYDPRLPGSWREILTSRGFLLEALVSLVCLPPGCSLAGGRGGGGLGVGPDAWAYCGEQVFCVVALILKPSLLYHPARSAVRGWLLFPSMSSSSFLGHVSSPSSLSFLSPFSSLSSFSLPPTARYDGSSSPTLDLLERTSGCEMGLRFWLR